MIRNKTAGSSHVSVQYVRTYVQKQALDCMFLWTDIIAIILIHNFQMAAQTGKFTNLARLVLPSTMNCVSREIEHVLPSAVVMVAEIAEMYVTVWVAVLNKVGIVRSLLARSLNHSNQ